MRRYSEQMSNALVLVLMCKFPHIVVVFPLPETPCLNISYYTFELYPDMVLSPNAARRPICACKTTKLASLPMRRHRIVEKQLLHYSQRGT